MNAHHSGVRTLAALLAALIPCSSFARDVASVRSTLSTAIILLFFVPLATSAQIVVGVIAPTEGPLATLGKAVVDGTTLAVQVINARGGINGKKLELLPRDDSCDPGKARQLTRALLEKGVVALFGYPCSASALSSREVAASANVAMFTVATAGPLTEIPNVPLVRIIGRDDRLAQMMADYVKAQVRDKRIGLVVSGRGTPFETLLSEALVKQGTRTLGTASGTDVKVEEWMRSIDALVVSPSMGATTAVALARTLPSQQIVAASPVFGDAESKAAAEFRNLTFISNPGPKFFPAAAEAVAQAEREKVNPGGYFLYAYAAVQMFAAAAAKGGAFSGKDLIARLREGSTPTVLGNLSFDSKGDIVGWRFAVTSRAGGGVASVDVCKEPNCKEYSNCPPDCPK